MPKRQTKKQSNKNKSLSKTYGTPTPPGRRPNKKTTKLSIPACCEQVCSQVDPFCTAAVGSKIYDTSTKPSIPYQAKKFFTIATDAAGQGALEVIGSPNYFAFPMSTFTGTVVNWGAGTNVPDYTNMSNVYDSYRVVSMGVRVFCSANVTESKGTVILATTTGHGAFDINTENYPEVMRATLAGCELTWVSKPNGPAASDFIPFTSTDESAMTSLKIGIQGGSASTTVIAVEVIVNYELLPITNTTVARLATPAAPHRPLISTVAANVQAKQASAQSGTLAERATNFWDLAKEGLKAVETYGPMVLALM